MHRDHDFAVLLKGFLESLNEADGFVLQRVRILLPWMISAAVPLRGRRAEPPRAGAQACPAAAGRGSQHLCGTAAGRTSDLQQDSSTHEPLHPKQASAPSRLPTEKQDQSDRGLTLSARERPKTAHKMQSNSQMPIKENPVRYKQMVRVV